MKYKNLHRLSLFFHAVFLPSPHKLSKVTPVFNKGDMQRMQ